MRTPSILEACQMIEVSEKEVQKHITENCNSTAYDLRIECKEYLEMRDALFEKSGTSEETNALFDILENVFRTLKRHGIDAQREAENMTY